MKTTVLHTEKTTISDKLHKQALAWFEDHRQRGEFIRRYVPGEFSAQAEADMRRDLGDTVLYVLVKYLGAPLTARLPLTAEMYRELPMELKAAPLIDLSTYREHRCAQD